MVATDFVENVLDAFKNIIREIEKGSSELEIRRTFDELFLRGVLGYERKNIKWEKKRADLTIVDENDFAIVKIETKKPTEDIDRKDYEEQAFKYEEETTRYIGLTNFLRFKLWEIQKDGSKLRVNLDFSKKKSIEDLSADEKSQILFLNNLAKETIFDTRKYQRFNETYAKIDITKEGGFRKLLDQLNFIVNVLLLGYTLKAFGEYKEGYTSYKKELEVVEKESKTNNKELNHNIIRYKQKLEEKYKKYIPFSGFYLWKQYSGKEDVPDDDVKEIFCKETIYVFLNKLLFLRICEDKGFLEKNISNGGIEQLREFLKKRFAEDAINKEILELAFKSASGLYSHFYEIGILDWFRTGNGELNEILNRVLWILNQFDFTHVDRDILGNLYEKYLPSNERKRLGEFYTPVEIIDYILTSVGYTYSNEIENKDLLDPACGSGGFLVRATRRLISRFLMKFGKANKRELREPKNWKEIVNRLSSDEAKIIVEAIQEHIYGLDINPFACHIAEMNMLFQIIDLYQKVREKYPNYKLKRFKIYRTDSLEKPTQKQLFDWTHKAFLEEQEEIDAIKNKKFDFVVENPPYVRKERITSSEKHKLAKDYFEIYHGDNDYYVYFLYRSIKWLNEKGKFGVIVSSKFTKTRYGKYIRAFIIENVHISKFIDLRGSKVFANVTVDPCILILDREKKTNEIRIINVKKDFEGKSWEESLSKLIWHIFKNGVKDFEDEYISSFTVDQRNLIKMLMTINNKKILETWKLERKETVNILNKLDKHSTKLNELCIKIEEGLTTGKNDIFIIEKELISKHKFENEALKPIVRGEDIEKYNINFKNLYVIYLNKTDVGKYHNIKEYLNSFKEELVNRAAVKYLNKKWFELQKPRSEEIFTNTKIITPDISQNNRFALDENGKYFCLDTTKFIILKSEYQKYLKYILGILNSSIIEFYIKRISSFLGKKGYRYKTQYLKKLPIKLPKTPEEKKIAEQIIKKVDEILELHKSGIVDIDAILESEETEKLYNLPKVAFNIKDKDNAKFKKVKVDGNKIFINSQDFIEVKDKKIRDFIEVYLNYNKEKLAKSKDVKNLVLNIPIPKSDEVLNEIIKKGGIDQSQIREKIKSLENEINELVYQIYEITKEERKIVEGNL